jgi:hypothetical protein
MLFNLVFLGANIAKMPVELKKERPRYLSFFSIDVSKV